MTQATLSREERHRLLDTLRGLDPTRCGLPKEHRRVRRRGVLEWMRIHVPPRRNEDRARVLRVLVKDVAAGGVGLYTRRVFAKNDRFVFPVHFMEGGGKLYLCEVVFCQRCSPRHFAVGAKFIASMEDPDGSAVVPTQWLEPTTPTD